jgi:DNA adenine methylase
MKTPISYYGAKQNLLDVLIPMIPQHTQYVEPFCGSASLFWAKPKTENEVINDFDLRVVNFWRVLQSDFHALQQKIEQTLHHENNHTVAKQILKAEIVDPVEYAWAFWVQTVMSFSFKIFGGFAFSLERQESKTIRIKREQFTIEYYNRIKDVCIFNRDAIDLILVKDNPETFMYFDPPYAESNCGHYEDKKEVYYRLLEILPTLKCKWLMSSYPSTELNELRDKHGFNFKDQLQNLSVSGKHNEGKMKTECLTYNYTVPQLTLFDLQKTA